MGLKRPFNLGRNDLTTMRHLLRTLFIGLLLPGFTHVLAQPYPVTISGHITPCTPAIAGGSVLVQSGPGVLPVINELVPLNPNCFYTITVLMDDTSGMFSATATCDGITVTNNGWYSVNSMLGTGSLTLDFNCGPPPPPDCQACILASQATSGGALIPFTANYLTCSTGGTAPYTFLWTLPDGSSSSMPGFMYEFPGEGMYALCLTITDANACTSTVCDTVYVDQNGIISTTPLPCPPSFSVNFTTQINGNTVFFNATSNVPGSNFIWDFGDGSFGGGTAVAHAFADGGPYNVCLSAWTWNGVDTCFSAPVCQTVGPFGTGVPDCLGIIDGPNMPGTPCSTPAGGNGVWNADCVCIPNTFDPCQAGFWVIQAYTVDSMPGGGTSVQPIPFELWIWNLSSGGTGNYDFVWDFGDGNTSTDAFPTHVYGSSGPYLLCLTITDDAGCTSTACDTIQVDQDGMLGLSTGPDVRSTLTINVIQELPTSVVERPALEATRMWPNPVQDQFTLQLNSSRSGAVELSIIDLNGREVQRSSLALHSGMNMLQLNVDGLQGGMYLLRLNNGQHAATLRFVKH